jgi:hypothetical protein
MNVKKYIPIADFCRGHALEESFVYSLHEIELIEIRQIEAKAVIPRSDLRRLERLVRLHRDLEISPEALLAVDHLLDQVEALQEEVITLRRRLNRWE